MLLPPCVLASGLDCFGCIEHAAKAINPAAARLAAE
jgi:hypothetical protein